ncbi:DUF1461 domain-containing protein [Marinimicrobium locisalis]|uniref:lipoprotein intramolecular transacylase Lit n=1 Tax=Marinimicrobium locisalis TaxID=546022 RepID=UPI0032221BDA
MLARFFHRFALWPLLLISHFLVASLLAWHLLAKIDFGYAWAYPALDIQAHIERFGPLNRYKPGFGETGKEEHFRLFGEITESIQSGGEGLSEIRYPLPGGQETPLMREAEVIHLQDVARLVSLYYAVGLAAGGLFLLLVVYAYRRAQRPPRPARVLWVTLVSLLLGAALLALIGPVKVFYWLHEHAFPDDHEWFFYYQDSLMTTLMKAPDLFGFIGALLLLLTLVLWGASGALLWRWLSRAPVRS